MRVPEREKRDRDRSRKNIKEIMSETFPLTLTYTLMKINSKFSIDLYVRAKTIQLLETNIGKIFAAMMQPKIS